MVEFVPGLDEEMPTGRIRDATWEGARMEGQRELNSRAAAEKRVP